MCKPRANRVHLRTAQRPYPASMGNISRYKGAECSSDTSQAHIQYKQCLSHRRRTSARGCVLFMVRPPHPCGVLTGTVMWKCIRFSGVYTLCPSVLLPKGETKQCQERLLRLNRRQRAQYYSWWTSASGIIPPPPAEALIKTFNHLQRKLNVVSLCKLNLYCVLFGADQPCAKHPSYSCVCQS